MTVFATDDAGAPPPAQTAKKKPFGNQPDASTVPLARTTFLSKSQKKSTPRRAVARPSPPAHDAFDTELAYGDAHRRVLAVDAPEPVRARAEPSAREVHRPANAKRERVARLDVEPRAFFFFALVRSFINRLQKSL